jgi:hypothetical protein
MVSWNSNIVGLGGTYNSSGIYGDKNTESNIQLNGGINVRLESLILGTNVKSYLNNPFTRFHESIEKNPHFHDDMDDIGFQEYDNWERLKPFDPKDGTTVGETFAIPKEDNDQKLEFFDVQGESVYTNPPDSNMPLIDHRMDEEHIWAFSLTNYN